MLIRKHYLEQIRPYNDDTNTVKFITGMRGCGKTTILSQIMDELKADRKRIIYLDFDSMQTKAQYPSLASVLQYINTTTAGPDILYVFLDEPQSLSDYAAQLPFLIAEENISLFLAGSSRSLTDHFFGSLENPSRTFQIHPFVYREILELMDSLKWIYTTTDYLMWGGLPAVVKETDNKARIRYLSRLNRSAVLDEVEKRCNIKKTDIYERLSDIVLTSNGSIMSALSISDKLKDDNIFLSAATVIKYLGYLKDTFALKEVPLFSSKSGKRMKYYYKVYDEDVSLNTVRQKASHYDLTGSMENIIINELIFMGYDVCSQKDRYTHVDFRAEKDGKVYLIQTADRMDDKAGQEKARIFSKMDYTYEKIFITNDEADLTTSTVRHIRFKDFLKLDGLEKDR